VNEPSVPPGSALAQMLGCACPIAENRSGLGVRFNDFGEREFVYSPSCKHHGELAKAKK
jgi:hypothetical protein